MSQPNFFTPIDFEKRSQIIDDLHRTGAEIFIKVKDDFYKTKILKKKESSLFVIFPFIPGKFSDQALLGAFSHEQGKFYFKGSVSTQGKDLVLSIKNELFQLVRRNDFRVNLPVDAPYPCQIIQIGNKKTKIDAKLRNVSLGGCLIAVPKEGGDVKIGEEVFIKITVKDFEPERIICVVRQLKPDTETSNNLMGLQFKDPETDFLTDLQAALIFLDRTHRNARKD